MVQQRHWGLLVERVMLVVLLAVGLPLFGAALVWLLVFVTTSPLMVLLLPLFVGWGNYAADGRLDRAYWVVLASAVLLPVVAAPWLVQQYGADALAECAANARGVGVGLVLAQAACGYFVLAQCYVLAVLGVALASLPIALWRVRRWWQQNARPGRRQA